MYSKSHEERSSKRAEVFLLAASTIHPALRQETETLRPKIHRRVEKFSKMFWDQIKNLSETKKSV